MLAIAVLDVQVSFAQSGSLVVGSPTIDANGVQSYPVTSGFQGSQPTILRVLEPTNPAPGQPHRFLYVLPVTDGLTDLNSPYSDGLEELRLLDVHNRFNITLIAPSFHIEPWYGDHVSIVSRRLESFIVQHVVPFGDSFAGPSPRWVLGFSKSGFGALTLLLRNAAVFSAAAAWDAPAQFTDLSQFGMWDNFGSETHFDSYEIPGLVLTNAEPFRTQNRIWISGDQSAWEWHMVELHVQMTQAGILHTFVQSGPRSHAWDSGWLEGAIQSLVSASVPDAIPPVRSNGLPAGTLAAGTTQTTLSLITNEAATCRFATAPGVAYAAMPNPFTTTGGVSHSTAVTGLANGASYSFFVRCRDAAGNANSNDFTISFAVAQPADTTPAVRSNGLPTGTLAAGTTQTSLSLVTNEAATCRFATTTGVAYAAMPNLFTATGATTHSVTVTGLTNGTSYSFFVRCQDTAGNANPNDFTISFAVAQSSPTGGLVAAYGFNEGSGTTVGDASGKGHSGAIAGATWTTQGKFGKALVFDGVNDWVTIADAPALDLSTAMTLEAWVYPTTTSGVRDILIKEGTGVDIYNLYARNWRGRPESNVYVGGTNRVAEGSTLPANVWTHVAVTYDGASLRLFINGVQVATTTVSGSIPASSGPLRIGGNSLWGEFFKGRIDEIRVYNRVLTQSEIQADMTTPIP